MRRAAGLLLTLAASVGCSSPDGGMGGYGMNPMHMGHAPMPPTIRNAQGPWGEPVSAQVAVGPHAPGAFGGVGPEMPFGNPFGGPPMNPMMPPPGIIQAAFAPPGMPPGMPGAQPLGKDGMPMPVFRRPDGAVHAFGVPPQGAGPAFPLQRSQVRFVGPNGAKIGWYVPAPMTDPDGKPILLAHQLDVPGRYNFLQASIYRLKLSDIPGRPGLELYPTVEVVPCNAKTDAFLAHNFIPIEFTEEDFDQVTAGNYITKVVYLPDAHNQSPIAGGPAELVSTRLDPGVDPVAEAHRRGHILLVVRLGGIDLESANTPPMDNPGQFGPPRPMMPRPSMMLPGVAPGAPMGLPGQPPVMPPQGPNVTLPAGPPDGPMVPAALGTLPPPPVPGMGMMKAKEGDVKQTGFKDARRGNIFKGHGPMTTITVPIEEKVEPKPGRAPRKGLLDDMFNKDK